MGSETERSLVTDVAMLISELLNIHAKNHLKYYKDHNNRTSFVTCH